VALNLCTPKTKKAADRSKAVCVTADLLERFFETRPSWLAALGLDQLSVRTKHPLGESAPVAVIVGRGDGGIPLGFVKLALPPNAVADFVAKIL
jgi:hypothetical protein